MKIKKSSVVNNGIIITILLFAVVGAYLAINLNKAEEKNYYGDTYICNDQKVIFRSQIEPCLNVTVYPSDEVLATILLNKKVENIFILVDPNGTAGLGVSVYDIYKGIESVGINRGVVYTKGWPDDPEVPVMNISQATYKNPIVSVLPNQDETYIDASGAGIVLSAKNQRGLDAAACKISLTLIKKKFEC